jgi:hypothetical protein
VKLFSSSVGGREAPNELGSKEGAILNLCTRTSSLFHPKTKKDPNAETSCLSQKTRIWTKSRNQATLNAIYPSEMVLDIYYTKWQLAYES